MSGPSEHNTYRSMFMHRVVSCRLCRKRIINKDEIGQKNSVSLASRTIYSEVNCQAVKYISSHKTLGSRWGKNIDSHEVFNSIKKLTIQPEEKAFPSLYAVFVIHKLTFILAISEVIRLINGLMKGWNFSHTPKT